MTTENILKPGIYKHYKGSFYEVITVARHSETEEQLVVYKALYGNRSTWLRPFQMFIEKVEINGESLPRFDFIEDSSASKI